MKSQSREVLIIGGGIGGLSLASGLADQDWKVKVVELGNGLAGGSGLGFPAYAYDALGYLGLQEPVSRVGFSNTKVKLCDANGNLIRVKVHDQIPGREGPVELMLGRPALIDTLRAEALNRQVEISYNTTFLRIEEQGSAVRVWFTDGSVGDFDLVIGADGLNSAVRREYVAPGLTPRDTEGGFFRTLVPLSDTLSEAYAFEGEEGLVYTYPSGSGVVYAGIFVANSRGYLSDDEARDEFVRILETFSTPQTAALIAEIRDYKAPVNFRGVQALFVEDPVIGRVVLIGDAAHTMPPNLGGGGSMAVEDASVLSRMIGSVDSKEVPNVLKEYSARRHPRVSRVLKDSWTVFSNGPSLDNWGGRKELKTAYTAWINTPA
ncbi:FAD-dependent monooxygenase [Agromyces sp. NPDC058484]|uniref:FAD-dependent monooxygenase n=1 Tax=Agromyces sp. NPDC058484 TaxID=3346524 RepID=UPI0036501A50